MGNVDYGPIFRLDIQDKIWSRRDSHFRKSSNYPWKSFDLRTLGDGLRLPGLDRPLKLLLKSSSPTTINPLKNKVVKLPEEDDRISFVERRVRKIASRQVMNACT
ncbi:hypothetical protein TrVFT333_006731 [Trichoderma virens FT-333]|nr:hypothetical protein TrVFT333_006731 [Trichoderma virens FT-333]